jgi:hypothetical protein
VRIGAIELLEGRQRIVAPGECRRQVVMAVLAVAPYGRIEDAARGQSGPQAGERMLELGRSGFMRTYMDQVPGHGVSASDRWDGVLTLVRWQRHRVVQGVCCAWGPRCLSF